MGQGGAGTDRGALWAVLRGAGGGQPAPTWVSPQSLWHCVQDRMAAGAWRQGRILGIRRWGLSKEGDSAEGEDGERLREKKPTDPAIHRDE